MDTLALMDRKKRSEYGTRLLTARKLKGLTQTDLAKAVGMSQSAYGQAETTGSGSSFTSQLAAACGVRAQWLATGLGPMLEGEHENGPTVEERISAALEVLSNALIPADEDTRHTVGELLSAMAESPQTVKNKGRLILRLLVTDGDKSHESTQDQKRQPQIFESLGVLDLGDGNGRSDTDAAAGGRKN